jgi:hypothetical protein
MWYYQSKVPVMVSIYMYMVYIFRYQWYQLVPWYHGMVLVYHWLVKITTMVLEYVHVYVLTTPTS